jgi:hypothetical protein
MNQRLINTVLVVLILLIPAAVCGQESKNNLFVFVGEKIDVKPFSPILPKGTILMDKAFKAKYKVIKEVYGHLEQDTIEFEAYDHYGSPAFAVYKHVLLYVSQTEEGKWYHQKYMYSDVYQTKDGRWAGPYQANDYNHEYNKGTTIKPEKLVFKERVSYEVKGQPKGDLFTRFPKPYYKIKGDKAYVIMGNYIEELFLLKKDGVLKARGLFGTEP